jgi:hypothetical protein
VIVKPPGSGGIWHFAWFRLVIFGRFQSYSDRVGAPTLFESALKDTIHGESYPYVSFSSSISDPVLPKETLMQAFPSL